VTRALFLLSGIFETRTLVTCDCNEVCWIEVVKTFVISDHDLLGEFASPGLFGVDTELVRLTDRLEQRPEVSE